MFEKLAEEYTLQKLVGLEDFDSYQSAYYRYENGVQDAFKDGAEFGYNKANEWHYVKDGDLPKEEGHYLVCLRNRDRDIFDCWIYYDKDIGWYSMEVRMKDIYAWKEIVPPKED